ncbi:MAG: TldD/PmbA family protein [archaeon GB-1867-005]|nr:TldD/PmbA family protein [Candidatus Culexmicrobium cathedralense]
MEFGEYALKIAERLGAEHAEVRYQRLERTALKLRNKGLEAVVEGIDEGIGVRVLFKGCWGFSHTPDLTKAGIEEAVRRAIKNAEIQGGKCNVKLAKAELVKGEYKFDYKIDPRTVDVSDKVLILVKGFENASEIAKEKLRSVEINYFDLWFKTHFMNSDGADAVQVGARFYFSFRVYGSTPAGLFYDSERFGMMAGLEKLEDSIIEVSSRMARRVVSQYNAKAPPIGPAQAILESRAAGDFFHEVGHSFEADSVVRGFSAFEGLKGQKVASEIITIYEDPTMPNAWGSQFFDDEGVKPKKTLLIENGVLRGYIHSRETASILGEEPTGHARAESYQHEPIIRMANLVLAPGDWKEEELIEETRSGIYISGARGGQTTGKGPFQFQASEAYLIEKGEISKPLKSVSVSMKILEALKNIDAICREANYYITLCGKGGQRMAVTALAPTMRIKKVIIGG